MPKEWFVMYSSTRWCGKRPRRFVPMGKGRFSLLTATVEYVISFAPFRGFYIVAWKRKTWGRSPGDGETLGERRRIDVKKVKIRDRASVKALASLDSKALQMYPAIVDSIGLLQYEDGSPRQPGYLGVWVQGSAWVTRITDKDAEATLTTEGKTLDEALELLNLMLGADDAPWEPVARRKRKGG